MLIPKIVAFGVTVGVAVGIRVDVEVAVGVRVEVAVAVSVGVRVIYQPYHGAQTGFHLSRGLLVRRVWLLPSAFIT